MTTGTFRRNDSSGSRLVRHQPHEMVGLVGESLGTPPPWVGGDAGGEDFVEGQAD